MGKNKEKTRTSADFRGGKYIYIYACIYIPSRSGAALLRLADTDHIARSTNSMTSPVLISVALAAGFIVAPSIAGTCSSIADGDCVACASVTDNSGGCRCTVLTLPMTLNG